MKRKLLVGLAVAGMAMTGLSTTAVGSDWTSTCTHGIAYNNSGHRSVKYLSSYSLSGQHIHRYNHDVANWFDHQKERNC